VLGFVEPGYIELASSNLTEDGSIGFSFQTEQNDALLLLAKGSIAVINISRSLLYPFSCSNSLSVYGCLEFSNLQSAGHGVNFWPFHFIGHQPV